MGTDTAVATDQKTSKPLEVKFDPAQLGKGLSGQYLSKALADNPMLQYFLVGADSKRLQMRDFYNGNYASQADPLLKAYEAAKGESPETLRERTQTEQAVVRQTIEDLKAIAALNKQQMENVELPTAIGPFSDHLKKLSAMRGQSHQAFESYLNETISMLEGTLKVSTTAADQGKLAEASMLGPVIAGKQGLKDLQEFQTTVLPQMKESLEMAVRHRDEMISLIKGGQYADGALYAATAAAFAAGPVAAAATTVGLPLMTRFGTAMAGGAEGARRSWGTIQEIGGEMIQAAELLPRWTQEVMQRIGERILPQAGNAYAYAYVNAPRAQRVAADALNTAADVSNLAELVKNLPADLRDLVNGIMLMARPRRGGVAGAGPPPPVSAPTRLSGGTTAAPPTTPITPATAGGASGPPLTGKALDMELERQIGEAVQNGEIGRAQQLSQIRSANAGGPAQDASGRGASGGIGGFLSRNPWVVTTVITGLVVSLFYLNVGGPEQAEEGEQRRRQAPAVDTDRKLGTTEIAKKREEIKLIQLEQEKEREEIRLKRITQEKERVATDKDRVALYRDELYNITVLKPVFDRQEIRDLMALFGDATEGAAKYAQAFFGKVYLEGQLEIERRKQNPDRKKIASLTAASEQVSQQLETFSAYAGAAWRVLGGPGAQGKIEELLRKTN